MRKVLCKQPTHWADSVGPKLGAAAAKDEVGEHEREEALLGMHRDFLKTENGKCNYWGIGLCFFIFIKRQKNANPAPEEAVRLNTF